MASDRDRREAPDWIRPQGEPAGLSHYAQVLRERRFLVVAVVLFALGAAGAYLWIADREYEAEARLLVTPAPPDDALLAALGVSRATTDPSRDVETIATLATSLDLAERVVDELGLDANPRAVQERVTAEPVATSNLISIEARGPTADQAADLANAFASGLVDARTMTLHDAANALLPRLREQLGPGDAAGLSPDSTLQADIARLEVLRASADPTVRVESEARAPSSAVYPKPAVTLVAALALGIALGVGGAFAAQTLDPRLRREEQLRSRYNLPILARVPLEASRTGRALGPAAIEMPTREAFRTLRANIVASQENPQASHAILVTGSSPSEGKSTTAINLASSLALAGNRVILLEADLRRPAIADALGIEVERGVVSTILQTSSIDRALTTAPALGPSLKLLLADYRGARMSELFTLQSTRALIQAAKERADYVVVDSPPLTTVVDALPLAHEVDDVIVVTRLGVTRLDQLPELTELLYNNGVTPSGFVVVGAERGDYGAYYFRDDAGDEPISREARAPEPAISRSERSSASESPPRDRFGSRPA